MYLRGMKRDGQILINENVKFNKSVLFKELWSVPWFVDGDNGSDSFSGLSAESSKKTIQAAITAAAREDVVYIRPKTWTSLPYSYPGLNTAYAESLIIPYAKAGLAVIGVGNQGFRGIPHGVVIRETLSAITANLKVYAPLCDFENLVFERGGTETGGQIVFQGGTPVTYEGNGGTVYNCYFYYANGTTGPGGWGGAVMADQVWGLTVRKCYFLGCRQGISFQSGGASAGSFIVQKNIFASRNTAASEIDCDIFMYTQGSVSLLIEGNLFAHLIPTLSGGGRLRYIYLTADVRQGLVTNNHIAGVQGGTHLTAGATGSAFVFPANVSQGANYTNGALMAETVS